MSRLGDAIATFRGHRQFHIDLIGRKRWWFALSGLVIAASLVGLFVRGLNYSIEFRGGARLQFTETTASTPDEIRSTLERLGVPDATVQIVGGNEVTVRTPRLDPNRLQKVLEGLADQAGISPGDITVETVSPTWGSQISKKAIQGLVIFLVLVTLYITFRFEWKMAIGGLVALFHDVIITAGVYALVGREVTPETVIAILTILGYSLYDTVVIYDKVKENTENLGLVSKEGYSSVVNTSLNQVFMRSINTSLVVLLPVGALLFFGGETLKDFAFALMIGIMAGAYSSIFVAAPLLAVLKEREPRYTQIRSRVARAGARPLRAATPARSAVGDGDGEVREPAAVTAAARPRQGGPSSRSAQARRKGGGGGGGKKKGKAKRRRR